jgi:hypothetical protein
MNSATSNLVILTAEINGDKLTGTAIDGDIKVLFTVGISIASVIAVVSLPVATPIEVATPSETQIAPSDAPAKSKRKTSTTRSKKTAKTPIAA